LKYIDRKISILHLLRRKSFFLFGPRGVGKSSLIKREIEGKAVVINLLRPDTYLRLSSSPGQLEEIIDASLPASSEWVVIDEVQKLPLLLDEVHRLIEERGLKFLLTGSSARKLKHGGGNLLAGRAWTANMMPLTSQELGDNFKLDHYLQFGGLPAVVTSEFPEEELQAYTGTYLQEEIKAEGLVRKLGPFATFLRAAALSNGQVMNFAKLASDVEVSAPTIREYFSILEDTMVGQLLEPWRGSRKRRAVAAAKFYFFDTGVTHTLAGTKALDPNSNLYGDAFEQWIFMELRAWLSYSRRHATLGYWRIDKDCEVDFLVGEDGAIEVKATRKLRNEDFRGLRALREEGVFKTFVIVSRDPIARIHDGILCLPWKEFVKRLWRIEASDSLVKLVSSES